MQAHLLPMAAIIAGLLLLLWSAEQFVSGAALIAKRLRMPSILIGMVIVGFGTSMPEMVVSGVAASNGNPGLALGNAYGSNITNIALILGLTALIAPIKVESSILKKEIPILLAVTLFSAWQLSDGQLSLWDAFGLLGIFALLIGWSIYVGFRNRDDALAQNIRDELNEREKPFWHALVALVVGLIVLISSSQLFVWGAVSLAHAFGVSDLVIGLTVVALGTSLPELASSIMAIRKNEHDLAVGNVLGSNLFNTLAVVGIAAMIEPFEVPSDILTRDWLVMTLLTIAVFLAGYKFRDDGRIQRWEGAVLLIAYFAYGGFIYFTAVAA